jgi:hypothetical protein
MKYQDEQRLSNEVGTWQRGFGCFGGGLGHAGSAREPGLQYKPKIMPKLFLHTRCLTKCQGHLGNYSGHQTSQVEVSLDEGYDGKVRLEESKT